MIDKFAAKKRIQQFLPNGLREMIVLMAQKLPQSSPTAILSAPEGAPGYHSENVTQAYTYWVLKMHNATENLSRSGHLLLDYAAPVNRVGSIPDLLESGDLRLLDEPIRRMFTDEFRLLDQPDSNILNSRLGWGSQYDSSTFWQEANNLLSVAKSEGVRNRPLEVFARVIELRLRFGVATTILDIIFNGDIRDQQPRYVRRAAKLVTTSSPAHFQRAFDGKPDLDQLAGLIRSKAWVDLADTFRWVHTKEGVAFWSDLQAGVEEQVEFFNALLYAVYGEKFRKALAGTEHQREAMIKLALEVIEDTVNKLRALPDTFTEKEVYRLWDLLIGWSLASNVTSRAVAARALEEYLDSIGKRPPMAVPPRLQDSRPPEEFMVIRDQVDRGRLQMLEELDRLARIGSENPSPFRPAPPPPPGERNSIFDRLSADQVAAAFSGRNTDPRVALRPRNEPSVIVDDWLEVPPRAPRGS